jgi:hypothetical protein
VVFFTGTRLAEYGTGPTVGGRSGAEVFDAIVVDVPRAILAWGGVSAADRCNNLCSFDAHGSSAIFAETPQGMSLW